MSELAPLSLASAICPCVDFHISCLGTCKHSEGVLYRLRQKSAVGGKAAKSPRIEIDPSNDAKHQLKIAVPDRDLPDGLLDMVTARYDALLQDCARNDIEALETLAKNYHEDIRLSSLCEPWCRHLHRRELGRAGTTAGDRSFGPWPAGRHDCGRWGPSGSAGGWRREYPDPPWPSPWPGCW